jgi:DNA-binding transcriptional MocR family regulator
MKTDTVFKRAFNDALDVVSKLEEGEPLPSENTLSARLKVSRTTVRKVLSTLAARGVISGAPRQRLVQSVHGDRALSRGRDGAYWNSGRETVHGVDAAGQCSSGHFHQRA